MKIGTIAVAGVMAALLGTTFLVAGIQNRDTGSTAADDTESSADQAAMALAGTTKSSCCAATTDGSTKDGGCCQSGDGGTTEASACCQTQADETCDSDQCAECAASSGNETKSNDESPAVAVRQQQGRRGPPPGRGPGAGRGMQRGVGRAGQAQGADNQFAEDHNVFFFLLDHREAIKREVNNIDNGIETVTESDDPDVAAKIQEHVSAMYDRVANVNPIHMRDPLFRELFANAEHIEMEMKDTPNGIWVRETSADPYVARLLQEHAKTVSLFIRNGRDELHRNHAVPEQSAAPDDPVISDHGKVVRLPSAAAQPRNGSKLCIDVTADGAKDQLNRAVEKLARYVNIYAAAGERPASAEITVVVHGAATGIALNDDAYAERFETTGNPNLSLIRQLRQAGVRFLVCGQSLASENMATSDVADSFEVAVSALTANVNCQQDGYAFIPLH